MSVFFPWCNYHPIIGRMHIINYYKLIDFIIANRKSCSSTIAAMFSRITLIYTLCENKAVAVVWDSSPLWIIQIRWHLLKSLLLRNQAKEICYCCYYQEFLFVINLAILDELSMLIVNKFVRVLVIMAICPLWIFSIWSVFHQGSLGSISYYIRYDNVLSPIFSPYL